MNIVNYKGYDRLCTLVEQRIFSYIGSSVRVLMCVYVVAQDAEFRNLVDLVRRLLLHHPNWRRVKSLCAGGWGLLKLSRPFSDIASCKCPLRQEVFLQQCFGRSLQLFAMPSSPQQSSTRNKQWCSWSGCWFTRMSEDRWFFFRILRKKRRWWALLISWEQEAAQEKS